MHKAGNLDTKERCGHGSSRRTPRKAAGALSAHGAGLLLTYAIPRRDTKPIAYALLDRFGSLHRVLQATPQELMKTPGIGDSAAVFINMMVPLFRA